MRLGRRSMIVGALASSCATPDTIVLPRKITPRLLGEPVEIAGQPDLGGLSSPEQQPVDFGLWRAADGDFRLWSCIRHTRETGQTRLFHAWQGPSLRSPSWSPRGIAMRADPTLGEVPGGLQAPYVFRRGGAFEMLYGGWDDICRARSTDGERFERVVGPNGRTGLFSEGKGANTRDAMVLPDGDRLLVYYTAHPGDRGAVYVRTTRDLVTFDAPRIVARGGRAGTGPFSAECPFVVRHPTGLFVLFRTQRYGPEAQTSVYASPDPLDFGVDDDRYLVTTLPLAAPEIVEEAGETFLVALRNDLRGIRAWRLGWEITRA